MNNCPVAGEIKGDDMSVLQNLMNYRTKFLAKENARAVKRESTFIEMTHRLADGENVPFDEIEKVCDSANAGSQPSCSSCPGSKVHKGKSNGAGTNCTCSNCGKEFVFQIPDGSVGEFSVERLMQHVEILVQRRADAVVSAERPVVEAEKANLQSDLTSEMNAREAYILESNKKCQDLSNEIAARENRLAVVDSANASLERTFSVLHPALSAQIASLSNERANYVGRASQILNDLFGDSPRRSLSDPFAGSNGARWLTFVRRFYDYEGGPIDVDSVDPTKRSPREHIPRDFTKEKYLADFGLYKAFFAQNIKPRIVELDRCEEESLRLSGEIETLRKRIFQP